MAIDFFSSEERHIDAFNKILSTFKLSKSESLYNEIQFSDIPIDTSGWDSFTHKSYGFTIAHPQATEITETPKHHKTDSALAIEFGTNESTILAKLLIQIKDF